MSIDPIASINAAIGNCFNYGKPGYWAQDCKSRKQPYVAISSGDTRALGSQVKGIFTGYIVR